MTEHERVSTPSPPPSADPRDTGRHTALPSAPRIPLAETTEERALRIALEARNGLGKPPDASGFEGTGLWRYVAGIKASVDKLVTWTETADKATARRTNIGATIAWEAVKAVVPAAVLALLAWVGGFLHR